MQAFWFGIITVLWAGFFLLEGFDFGVGILQPVVARTEDERVQVARSIGPVWDGNEVWLLVAGGATFAAFPAWYAGMFSGFYLAFALLLVGLILRGIGIEYRGKAHTAQGRRWCDVAFVGGSIVPALLLGVAFANLLRGVEMNAEGDVTSSFLSLLSPYALLGGVVTILAALGFVVWTDRTRGNLLTDAIAVVLVVAVVVAVLRTSAGRDGHAFLASSLAALLAPVWVLATLWPDVLPARNNPAWSLTVHNASSSPYTLRVMTVVALVMTPIVLAYQAWSYWVFRARVAGPDGGRSPRADQVVDRAKHSAATTLGLRRDPRPGTGSDAPTTTP